MFGVKSEDLLPLETFYVDILICLEGWVGVIRDVTAKLTLRLEEQSLKLKMNLVFIYFLKKGNSNQ